MKLARQFIVMVRLGTRMENDFFRRMDNWRRVVRGSGASGGCCAGWARLYVASRVHDESGPQYTGSLISPDVLDGWLVEAAVRSLISFDEKMALRYWHVFQYPEHWIKVKLMLRRSGVRLTLSRAENNLMRVLDKLSSPDIILSNKSQNNSHAGIVPRPDTSDSEVFGRVNTNEALID